MESKRIKKFVFGTMAICVLAAGAHTITASAATTNKSDNRAEMQQKMEAAQTERTEKMFDLFVSFGILDNADQAEKVKEYFTALQEKRKTVMEATKDMTDTERKAYFEANAGTQEDITNSSLVTDGIITEDQAATLALFLGGHKKTDSTEAPTEATIQAEKQATLNKLVEKGILTDSQASAVLNLKPEIREYGIYTDLVDNGTLDPDQANLLLSMDGGHGGFGGGPGGPGHDQGIEKKR